MLTPTTVGLERKCSVNNLMSGFGMISLENIRLCFFLLSTSSWFFSSSPDFSKPKQTWIKVIYGPCHSCTHVTKLVPRTCYTFRCHISKSPYIIYYLMLIVLPPYTFCTIFGSILGKSNSCSTQSKLPDFCRCCIIVLLIFLLRMLTWKKVRKRKCKNQSANNSHLI